MLIDPLTGTAVATVASSAGRIVAEKAIQSLIKKATSIEETTKNGFKIEGREMTILCPDRIQKYSISLTPKKTGVLPKSLKFSNGIPKRVELRQIMGLSQKKEAIKMTNDGFKINMKPLTSGELYILDLEYPIENPRFIESLVERTIPRDVPHKSEEDTVEYEMSAQIKHVGVLKQQYCGVDLRDVDFTVNVAVHQDVKTTIPGIFHEQLETMVELSKKKGRSEKFRLMMKQMQLQQSKYGGKELDILHELYDCFTPQSFKQFVEIKKDFSYHDCERGSDFYDTLPFPTWPKSMKVVSRTDLNLDKPAADGVLVYQHSDFISEIEKLFGLRKKQRKR